MPKDRRVNSLSIDRAMMSPYSCSLKNSESNNSENSFVGDEKEWEEARCPICIEHPHNAVLLICSSQEKGCWPFMCDTSYRHSNCLDQFRKLSSAESSSFLLEKQQSELVCPLCRGSIYGWIVIERARRFMDSKTRSCSLETCNFSGNYSELRKHARDKHPSSRPSVASPTRQLNWTTLEQQRDIQDALAHQLDDDDYNWSVLDATDGDDLSSGDSFFDFQMSDLEDEFEDIIDFGGGSVSFFSSYLSSLEEEMVNFDIVNSGDTDPLQRRSNLNNSNSRSYSEGRNALRSSRSQSSYRMENTPSIPRSRSNNHISRESSYRSNPRSRPSFYQDNAQTSSRTTWVHDREIGGSYSRPRLSYYFDNAPTSSRTTGRSQRRGDVQPNSGATPRYIDGRRVVHAIREFPDALMRHQPQP